MEHRKIHPRIRKKLFVKERGVETSDMKTWTNGEITMLVACFGKIPNEHLHEILPNKTPLAIYKKARKLGLVISDDVKFQNRSKAHSGEKCNFWKGGKKSNSAGYRLVLMPDHPRADRNGYVLEHIVVFEKATGISVPEGCCVHHLNGIKNDNRIENLCLMSHGAHTAMHHRGAKRTEETKKKISERMKKHA